MTTEPKSETVAPAPVEPEPTVHNAQRATDGSGAVEWWDDLDDRQAVARRRSGLDIVVRGEDKRENSAKAKAIEAAVGFWKCHAPHAREGPFALPHYQQDRPRPEGHSFYEVDNRKARKKS
jgi:hypothetical protein